MDKVAVTVALAVMLAANPVIAQKNPDTESMIQKLQSPAPSSSGVITRGLNRGIAPEGTQKPIAAPEINLQINFEFRSAELTTDGKIQLDSLAAAMTDKRLADSQFVIVGHTDAVGGEEYNRDLSMRRAVAVRDYLINTRHILATRLVAEGRGMTQLFQPSQPYSALNRRVQVINKSALTN
jgi:outer membrane protein OmpA-like peptidoglycan-associated protein